MMRGIFVVGLLFDFFKLEPERRADTYGAGYTVITAVKFNYRFDDRKTESGTHLGAFVELIDLVVSVPN